MATKKATTPKSEKEVEEIKSEETVNDVVPEQEAMPEDEPTPEPVIETPKPEVKPEPEIKTTVVNDPNLSNEEKIKAYVKDRTEPLIRLNEFLKSLFPTPKYNEPAGWNNIQASKGLRVTLANLQAEGVFKIKDDRHLLLGKPYHHGEQQLSANYTIANVEIFAQK